jgi:hypothetical protein
VTFDLGSTTLPIVAGSSSEEFPRSLSNATATLQIEGSEVTCELQYIDFLFPQEADFSVADTVPIAASPIEISDATTILRKGYAGGTITKANGLFFGAEGKTCDHRYVYGEVEHRDGVRTFFKQEVGVWLIQGFQGPANP